MMNFNPDYEADIHDPYLYKDMDKGVLCIKEAVDMVTRLWYMEIMMLMVYQPQSFYLAERGW